MFRLPRRERAHAVGGPCHHKFLQLNEAGNLGLTRRTPRHPEVKNDNFTVEVRRLSLVCHQYRSTPRRALLKRRRDPRRIPRERRAKGWEARTRTLLCEQDCYAKAPHRQIQRRDSHEYLFFRGMSSHPLCRLGRTWGAQFDGCLFSSYSAFSLRGIWNYRGCKDFNSFLSISIRF